MSPQRARLPGWLVSAMVVSLGGFLNGYDTGSIGALTTMPTFSDTFGILSPTQLGLAVSTVMLGGGVPALFAGPLAERFGAAHVIGAGAIVLLIGAAIEASSMTYAALIAGRVFVGFGQGLLLTNITVYTCEIAPSARRGMLVGAVQLLSSLGIVAGFFTCFGTAAITSSWSWRIPFVVQCGIALALILLLPLVPPSPRWLLSKGRRREAESAIARLSIPLAEAEKDILRISEGEQLSRSGMQRAAPIWSIFAAPVRLRTFLALFLLTMIQWTGVDGVLYYAPMLFRQAGLSAGSATFLASGGSAIAITVVSIPAFLYADKIGRRLSLIGGGLGMSACMFSIGALYETGSVQANKGGGLAVVVFIFLFVALYAATWAMSAKLYAGEILAPETRLAANSIAQGINFFMNFLVSLTAPILLARSSFAAYFLFGGLTLFTVMICIFHYPETKGLSLEAIQSDSFRHPRYRAVDKIWSMLRLRAHPEISPARMSRAT